MSANTIKKATALAKNGVVMIEDDLFQVKSSSDPSKSYMVTSDSCDCQGFKNFYKFISMFFQYCLRIEDIIIIYYS